MKIYHLTILKWNENVTKHKLTPHFLLSVHIFPLQIVITLNSPLFPLISLHFLSRATMEEEIFCHKNTAWTTNLVKDDSKNSGHYLWWFDKKAWFQICLENSHNLYWTKWKISSNLSKSLEPVVPRASELFLDHFFKMKGTKVIVFTVNDSPKGTEYETFLQTLFLSLFWRIKNT